MFKIQFAVDRKDQLSNSNDWEDITINLPSYYDIIFGDSNGNEFNKYSDFFVLKAGIGEVESNYNQSTLFHTCEEIRTVFEKTNPKHCLTIFQVNFVNIRGSAISVNTNKFKEIENVENMTIKRRQDERGFTANLIESEGRHNSEIDGLDMEKLTIIAIEYSRKSNS